MLTLLIRAVVHRGDTSCRQAIRAIAGQKPAHPIGRWKNHALAEERRRKRNELLDATEQDLKNIQKRIVRKRDPLRGADEIGLAVGKVIGRRKVAKHFDLTITDDQLEESRPVCDGRF